MMTTSLCTLLALCIVPGNPIAMPTHASIHGAVPEASEQPSSYWLAEAKKLQAQGELAQAGDAYEQALLAMSEDEERGEEGAIVALLAAKAHWGAFDRDPAAARLTAGVEVLELWLGLAGPRDASLVDEVQGESERLCAILDPLRAGDAALEAGDAIAASNHYDTAFDALAREPRDWSTGAGVALRVSDGFISAYDANVHSVADIEPHLYEIEQAARILEHWQSIRPADDRSERGVALEQRLGEVRSWIDEGKQAVAAIPVDPGPLPPPEPLERTEVRKYTPALMSAGILGGLAWLNTAAHVVSLATCNTNQCMNTATGVFWGLGVGLNAPSHVLAGVAGLRRGRLDGIAAAWDGAPERKSKRFIGTGVVLVVIGLAGRASTIGASGGYGDPSAFVIPFASQLSASAIAAGVALWSYGGAYGRARDWETLRRQDAGLANVRLSPLLGRGYSGLSITGRF